VSNWIRKPNRGARTKSPRWSGLHCGRTKLSWDTARVDRRRVPAGPAVVCRWDPASPKGHKRAIGVHLIETYEDKTASGCAADTLTLRIGDVGVRIRSGDPDMKLRVNGAARSFLVADGAADIEVRSAWSKLGQPAHTSLVFDSGGLWRLSRELENYVFHLTSPMYGPLPYKQARFDPDFTRGEVLLEGSYFDSRDPVDALEYPLDELLMMNLLAHGRGVEVHACGLEDSDGQGYLFLGHSGAGKTTMARLWQKAGGVQVLSDDRVILRSWAGKTWMYGTPWHGEAKLALPARTPLRQIFFLRHGTSNEVVPLGGAEALARFLACTFVPFYSRAGLDFVLAFFQQLIESLPCAELRFVPEERAVELARGHTA